MQPVIYVDMLFLINAMLGYFLLRAVGALCHHVPNLLRIVLSSILAGFSAFIILLPSLPWWSIWAYNIAIAALICLCAFGFVNVRMLLRNMFWYLVLNLALAGVVMLAVFYTGTSGMSLHNQAIYFDISPLVLLLCVVVTYLCVKLSGLLFVPVNANEKAWIKFTCKGLPCQCTALIDTGFSVKDMSGKSTFLVSLISLNGQISPLLYADIENFFNGNTPTNNVFSIACINTVTGIKALPSIKVTDIYIKHKKQELKLKDAAAIISSQAVGDGSFDAIISAQMMS